MAAKATKRNGRVGFTPPSATKGEEIVIDRTRLNDDVVCLFHDQYRLTPDELLCQPEEAKRFCSLIRAIIADRMTVAGWPEPILTFVVQGEAVPLSDYIILKTLLNSRKRSALK